MAGRNRISGLAQSRKKKFKSFLPQREPGFYYPPGFGAAGRRTLINSNTPQKIFIMRTLLIFAAMVLFSAIVYAATRLNSGKVPAGDLSGAADRPLCSSLSVIIDETDRMTKEHLAGMVKEIKFKVDSMKAGDRISLYVIEKDQSDSSGRLALLFGKNRPRDGSGANFLNENPPRIKKKFIEEYAAPLQEAIARLNPDQTARTSPLLESIKDVSRFAGFSANQHRELWICSNMLENSSQISFYGKNWKNFNRLLKRSLHILDVANILAGVNVMVYRIPDPNYTPAHEEWWKKYFEYAGANYKSYQL
jgi:hypothetical protein